MYWLEKSLKRKFREMWVKFGVIRREPEKNIEKFGKHLREIGRKFEKVKENLNTNFNKIREKC